MVEMRPLREGYAAGLRRYSIGKERIATPLAIILVIMPIRWHRTLYGFFSVQKVRSGLHSLYSDCSDDPTVRGANCVDLEQQHVRIRNRRLLRELV